MVDRLGPILGQQMDALQLLISMGTMANGKDDEQFGAAVISALMAATEEHLKKLRNAPRECHPGLIGNRTATAQVECRRDGGN